MAKLCSLEGVDDELLGGLLSSFVKKLQNLQPQKQFTNLTSNLATSIVKTFDPRTYTRNPLGVANAVLNPLHAVKYSVQGITDPATASVNLLFPVGTVSAGTGGKTEAQRQAAAQASTAQTAVQDPQFVAAVQNAGYNVNQLSQQDLATLYAAFVSQKQSSGFSINKKYLFFGIAGLAAVIYLARR